MARSPGRGLFVFFTLIVLALGWRVLRPVPVQSHTVGTGDVMNELYGRGTVESEHETDLGFDRPGRVSEVRVDEGDPVRMGQELARLDMGEIEQEVKVASSTVAEARAALERLGTEERLARDALEIATRDEQRTLHLSKSGAVADQDADDAADAARRARLDLERIAAEQTVASRSVQVARGTERLRGVSALNALLLAPFDGIVMRRFRDPGETVAVGTTLLRVADADALYVHALFDETVLPSMVPGQRAEVTLAGRDTPLAAHVGRVGWEVDRQTHEVVVDIVLDEAPPYRLGLGQRADVWVEITRRADVAALRHGLVNWDDQGESWVYVDRGGLVSWRSITLGLVGRSEAEVIDGLQAGDVVLAGVKPGAALPLWQRWSTR